MKTFLNDREILQSLERLVKGGSVGVVLKTETDKDDALDNELVIDYSYTLNGYKSNGPVLKIKENGVWKVLRTESDILFREFKDKVIEVDTDPTKPMPYKPSIYYRLRNGERKKLKKHKFDIQKPVFPYACSSSPWVVRKRSCL